MSRYAITERAGSFVAAHRNTGVGTVLDLTERQGNTFQSLHDAGRIRGTLWLQRQHASAGLFTGWWEARCLWSNARSALHDRQPSRRTAIAPSRRGRAERDQRQQHLLVRSRVHLYPRPATRLRTRGKPSPASVANVAQPVSLSSESFARAPIRIANFDERSG